MIFALGAVFDQLYGVVYYFAIMQNIYYKEGPYGA